VPGTTARTYYSYTIYPIGYLLNRIGGNRISTVSIQTNVDVQNATLNEDYENTLNNSISLVYLNGLEPYFDVYEKEIKACGADLLDLSSASIYAFKRYKPVNNDGILSFIESPYYEGDVFNYVDTYNDDLFLWLDPIGMLSMGKVVFNYLSSNYVEQASYFKDNYDQFEADLIALDASYQNLATMLQNDNKTIKFVSMTPSFGSWQKAYGIEVYPVCLSKYGVLPTDSQLEIIKQKIVDDKVEYIAYEPNMSADMANLFNTLESELGLKRINLYNLSSLTTSQIADNKDYLTIMYDNLAILENIATIAEVKEIQEVTE